MIKQIKKIHIIVQAIAEICKAAPKWFWIFVGIALLMISFGIMISFIFYGGIKIERNAEEINLLETDIENIESIIKTNNVFNP